LVLATAWAGIAGAADRLNVDKKQQVAGSPLALRGYDPVAYFTEGEPRKGSKDFVAVVDGAAYLFVSAEHRKAFEKDPQRYRPAYGGFCAYGVAKGKKYDGDPEVFKVVDGRLYLNYSASVQRRWEKDVPGYVKKAEGQWPKIVDQPAD
jgi:YHS domain-containing protein